MTPNSSFLKYGDFQFNFSEFSYKKDQKYNPWLWSNKSIYNVPTIKIPPGTLKDCKELFEKDVLPIKKLAKDIGDLNKIILNEQNDFFLHDNSNILTHTFFTEVNKKLQSYGMISTEYDRNNENLISLKIRLKFNILYNIQEELIRLQLENILTPKNIGMVDLKITNFSILSVERQNKMVIADKFIIEGFQNFEQYLKINPISIQINDFEIENKLLFYANKYKYRFIVNSILFSSSVQKDTNAIFIITNGLNNAKEILINGKIFQGIGVYWNIYFRNRRVEKQ